MCTWGRPWGWGSRKMACGAGTPVSPWGGYGSPNLISARCRTPLAALVETPDKPAPPSRTAVGPCQALGLVLSCHTGLKKQYCCHKVERGYQLLTTETGRASRAHPRGRLPQTQVPETNLIPSLRSRPSPLLLALGPVSLREKNLWQFCSERE